MANPEHVVVVKLGAEAIRKWREANPDTRFDLGEADLNWAKLAEADLSGADLGYADLSDADLHSANLSNAFLGRTQLRSANLSSANLANIYLGGADLSDADLSGANLCKANLSGDRPGTPGVIGSGSLGMARLMRANVSGANFSGADVATVDLRNVNLSNANFGNANLSGTNLSGQFLGGYSHTDEEFAKWLYSRMRDEQLRVWYAPEDMKSGHKIHEQIEQAIRVYDKLLLVLSETSMSSEWVATEIYHARQREVQEKRQILFPIRLVPFEAVKEWTCFDADTGKDMAREIREYFIPDFSDWKDHDSFEAGFKRLLADMKADRSRG